MPLKYVYKKQIYQRLQLLDELLQPADEFTIQLVMAHGIFHIGFHVAQLAAAIVALALHEVGVDLLLLHQHGDGVRQLDLVTGTGRCLLQQRPDIGGEDVTTHHRQIGGLRHGAASRQWPASAGTSPRSGPRP